MRVIPHVVVNSETASQITELPKRILPNRRHAVGGIAHISPSRKPRFVIGSLKIAHLRESILSKKDMWPLATILHSTRHSRDRDSMRARLLSQDFRFASRSSQR